ncbi:MAG TPA: phage/plasmid primase, P4 family [Candidatus Polarisedimenticolia bacterium]|jgi:putative DNA primase/helicase
MNGAAVLRPEHKFELERSGIAPDVIAEAGVRSVEDAEAHDFGFRNGGLPVDGLLFPFIDIEAGTWSGRFALLKPDLHANGAKYLSPYGERLRLHFAPGAGALLQAVSVPVLWIEGVKKALAVESWRRRDGRTALVIGISGCWGWRRAIKGNLPDGSLGKIGSEPIPDFNLIAWKGREVIVGLDGDVVTKPDVARAERALVAELRRRGARVRVMRIPPAPDGSRRGADDFIVQEGDEAWARLLDEAHPYGEAANAKWSDLRTELGYAREFVRMHGRDLLHVVAWRKWLSWDGTRWRIDDTGEVRRLAKSFTRAATQAALDANDKDGIAICLKMEKARALESWLSLAATEAEVAISPEVLDRDTWLLNVENGALDLHSGELQPHRREDLITKLAPVAYDPEATAPLFDAFLARVLPDPEVRAFVQRFLGYALTGTVGEHLLVFFYGTGRNGKSTLLIVVLRILAEYGIQAPPGLLLAIAERDHPTGITTLFGRRLAVSMEAGEGRRFREELVKQLTGGDRLSARRMREDFWEFDPTHKLILSANHRPDIRGTDVAIWSRIALVPFTVTIPRAERDKDLPDKLMKEAPGILRWLADGCREWQRIGLAPPEAVSAATDEYRALVDTVGEFIGERCIAYDGAKVTKGVLYRGYVEWARARGEEPLTQRAFGERMIERGFTELREGKDRTRTWNGIGLLATDREDE